LVDMFEMDMKSGDFYLDQYYKILNMVLVRDFNNGDLHAIIENMIAEGDFQLIFKKI